MNKIFIIIKREYLSRVRKRSFIIMTILGPLLIAALYGTLIWIALSEEEEHLKINVVDNSEIRIFDEIKSRNKNTNIEYVNVVNDLIAAQKTIGEASFDAILFIPRDPLNNSSAASLYFKKRPNLSSVQSIEWLMSDIIEDYKLKVNNIDKEQFDYVRTDIHLSQQMINEEGDSEHVNETPYILAIIFGFMIYFFILLYGVQVMRGVAEEKSNRVVEIIISSVKPFQLMCGKIIGIGLTGLTQFLIWAFLSGIAVSIVTAVISGSMTDPSHLQQTLEDINQQQLDKGADTNLDLKAFGDFIGGSDFTVMICAFIFFFLGGYLLYGALFAAVGSLVDADTESSQFTLPVTLPLIFSIAVAQYVLKNPDGDTAVFFSYFPFTSPIVMMVRIPFGVPYYEVAISAILLILGFVFTTWIASKIYRTGILMYGKRISYKEVFQWLFYK